MEWNLASTNVPRQRSLEADLKNIICHPWCEHHLRELDPEEMYKHLGANEGDGKNNSAMKEKGIFQGIQARAKAWA